MSTVARQLALGTFVVLVGCNTLVGLDSGEPRAGSGGAAASSSGGHLPAQVSSSGSASSSGHGPVGATAGSVTSSASSSGLACANGLPLGATVNDCGAPSCPAYQSELPMQVPGLQQRNLQKLADGSVPMAGMTVPPDAYGADGLALSYVGGGSGHLEWRDAQPGVSVVPICDSPMQCGKVGIRVDFQPPIRVFAAVVAASFDYLVRDAQGTTLVLVVGPPPTGTSAQFFEYVSDKPVGSVELTWAEGNAWVSDLDWLVCP